MAYGRNPSRRRSAAPTRRNGVNRGGRRSAGRAVRGVSSRGRVSRQPTVKIQLQLVSPPIGQTASPAFGDNVAAVPTQKAKF